MAENTQAQAVGLAFLAGRWEGVGVSDFPDGEEFQFGQEVEFGETGGPYLSYQSSIWRLDDAGAPAELVTQESGYWRIRPDEARGSSGADGAVEPHVEVLITHPEGFTELYYGTLFATRVELGTDAVLRSDTAPEASAGQRLYGLIGEDRATLGYAWDLQLGDRTVQMSAQLKAVPKSAE